MEENKVWDVIIIGGGMAGLAASVYLARAGKSVLLLEKAPALGGRASTTKKAGAMLNLGPHALYVNGPGAKVLRELGVQPQGAKLNMTSAAAVFGSRQGEGGQIAFAHQLMIGTLLTWSEKMEFLRFFTSLRKFNVQELDHVPIGQFLTQRVICEKVQRIILAFVRLSTYTHAPELLSAGTAVRQLQLSSVIYLHQGWQQMVDELEKTAIRSGVTIEKSSSVSKLEGAFPHMTVTLSSQRIFHARNVLSAIGPRETLSLLDEPARVKAESSLNSLIPVRAACFDLVLSKLPKPKINFSLGVDEPLYYSNHSSAAKLTDDPKHQVIHVMKYLHPREEPDGDQVKKELEHYLSLLQPGWQKQVVTSRYMPHLSVSHALSEASRGGITARPQPEFTAIPGLYAAGDWAGSEGLLLDAALASAKSAASIIMKKN